MAPSLALGLRGRGAAPLRRDTATDRRATLGSRPPHASVERRAILAGEGAPVIGAGLVAIIAIAAFVAR